MTMHFTNNETPYDKVARMYAQIGLMEELKKVLKEVKLSIRLEYVRVEIMAEKIERTCEITGVLDDSIRSFTKAVEEYIMSSIWEKGTEISANTGKNRKEVLKELLTTDNAQECIDWFVPNYKDDLLQDISLIKISYEKGLDDYETITSEEVVAKKNEFIKQAGLSFSDFKVPEAK